MDNYSEDKLKALRAELEATQKELEFLESESADNDLHLRLMRETLSSIELSMWGMR